MNGARYSRETVASNIMAFIQAVQLVEEVRWDVPVVVDHRPHISLADLVPRLHCQLHPGGQVQLVLEAE